jgi:hypothetical protein
LARPKVEGDSRGGNRILQVIGVVVLIVVVFKLLGRCSTRGGAANAVTGLVKA